MKKSLLLLLTLVFLACFIQVAHADVYLYGTIKTDPNNQAEFGRPYYEFTLTVESSGEGEVSYPHDVMVLVDVELYKTYDISWAINSKLNVTGIYVADQPNSYDPPVGFFLVTSIQYTMPETGWTATLNQLIGAISSIGKLLITLIVQVIFQLFGYSAPEWVIAGIIILFAAMFLIKYYRKLPWLVVFIGVALCVSIIAYMLSSFSGIPNFF